MPASKSCRVVWIVRMEKIIVDLTKNFLSGKMHYISGNYRYAHVYTSFFKKSVFYTTLLKPRVEQERAIHGKCKSSLNLSGQCNQYRL